MTGKFRELIAWELEENWDFPVLELILAITIIQVLSLVTLARDDADLLANISRPLWSSMVFVFAISAAVVFGRSFGESIERRKLVVLLSYPVSRVQVFVAKFLSNFLATLCLFGSALFVEGILLYMFKPNVYWLMFGDTWIMEVGNAPFIWGLMFFTLLLVVFFASSLMTFLSLMVKRFGLSVLIFLIYLFGMEYWAGAVGNRVPQAYLSLSLGPESIVRYLTAWYVNTFTENYMGTGALTVGFFLTGFCYLLMGGLVFLLASLILSQRIDLD